MLNPAADDTSYFWTYAQAALQRAIEEGKLKIFREFGYGEPASVEYEVKRLICDDAGNMEMMVDYKD